MLEKNRDAQTSSTGPSKPGPIFDKCVPLILGVAGHRDLHKDALPAIEREVRGVFTELREKYPHTPLAVMSPLADGADRLVASIAKEEGASLIVPLSWPAGVFDEQIHRTGDREGFDALFAQADQVVYMPLIEGVRADDVRASEDVQDRQYAGVGAYVARHNQILIALWDGDDKPESGTARVIAWQRGGQRAPYAPSVGRLDELENGPVYHITSPRCTDDPDSFCVERKICYPEDYQDDDVAAQAFDTMWSRVDQFNADVSRSDAAFAQQTQQSKDWLVPQQQQQALPEEIAELLDRFARADVAASKFQQATFTTLKGVFVLVALAVVCFELYAHLLVASWPLLAVYLGLLLASAGWYVLSKRRSEQAKYLDYRSMAEALRVEFFWRLAGLKESVADYYLRNLRTELDWIRQSVRSVNLVTGLHGAAEPPPRDEQIARLKLVRDSWIKGQRDYFASKGPMNEECHKRCKDFSGWFFWLAIALGVALLVVHLWTHQLNHPLVVAVFVSMAAAALCHEYGEKQAFAIHAKRYEWMRSFYDTAQRQIDGLIDAENIDECRQLILELGKEALQENAEWLLQHRQRPIVPPKL